MVKSISGLGQTFDFVVAGPFATLPDPQNKKLMVSTTLADSSELCLWMTDKQFQQLLHLLKLSALKLGVPWPQDPQEDEAYK